MSWPTTGRGYPVDRDLARYALEQIHPGEEPAPPAVLPEASQGAPVPLRRPADRASSVAHAGTSLVEEGTAGDYVDDAYTRRVLDYEVWAARIQMTVPVPELARTKRKGMLRYAALLHQADPRTTAVLQDIVRCGFDLWYYLVGAGFCTLEDSELLTDLSVLVVYPDWRSEYGHATKAITAEGRCGIPAKVEATWKPEWEYTRQAVWAACVRICQRTTPAYTAALRRHPGPRPVEPHQYMRDRYTDSACYAAYGGAHAQRYCRPAGTHDVQAMRLNGPVCDDCTAAIHTVMWCNDITDALSDILMGEGFNELLVGYAHSGQWHGLDYARHSRTMAARAAKCTTCTNKALHAQWALASPLYYILTPRYAPLVTLGALRQAHIELATERPLGSACFCADATLSRAGGDMITDERWHVSSPPAAHEPCIRAGTVCQSLHDKVRERVDITLAGTDPDWCHEAAATITAALGDLAAMSSSRHALDDQLAWFERRLRQAILEQTGIDDAATQAAAACTGLARLSALAARLHSTSPEAIDMDRLYHTQANAYITYKSAYRTCLELPADSSRKMNAYLLGLGSAICDYADPGLYSTLAATTTRLVSQHRPTEQPIHRS